MRTIVVGDVHGCREELDELLDKVKYQQGKDRVILAGDLVDRGPDSHGVLRLAREKGFEAVMGNHDEKQVRYRKHELKKKDNPKYVNPMKEFSPERLEEHLRYTEEDWAYLRALPCWLRVGPKLVVVHAGVMPDVPMEKQVPNHCMRLRYIRKSVMKMAQHEHVKKTPEDCVMWWELWDGPDTVIYGHQVVEGYLHPNVCSEWHSGMMKDGPRLKALAIDGGCCFGGALTAAIHEPMVKDSEIMCVRVESVRAKKMYRPLAPWTDED